MFLSENYLNLVTVIIETNNSSSHNPHTSVLKYKFMQNYYKVDS